MVITEQNPVTKFLNEYDDTVREKCGIVGIYDPNGDAVTSAYLAVNALQHRGQDGVGLSYIEEYTEEQSYDERGRLAEVGIKIKQALGRATFGLLKNYLPEDYNSSFSGADRDKTNETSIKVQKALGRVAVGFNKGKALRGIKADYATAHVRYGTTEAEDPFDALHPIKIEALDQEYTVSHNGQFDMGVLSRVAFEHGMDPVGTDSEIFSALLAKNIEHYGHIEPAMHNLLPQMEGAFSLSILGPEGIYAVRDRHGVRPLVLGNKNGATMIASEECGLKGTDNKDVEQLGFEFVRDVDPGTYVVINKSGVRTERWATEDKGECMFERVYLSKPNKKVSQYRYNAGKMLAEMEDEESDIIVPVLGSAKIYARGYEAVSGVKYTEALRKNPKRKNPESDRTFIEKTQEDREAAVRQKFLIDAKAVKDKVITLVDDSLVRGTTTKIIIQMLREAGAKAVHVRIGSNIYSDTCRFGVNVQSKDELLSHNSTVEEMAKAIGADTLRFLPLEKMHEAAEVKADDVCDGCMGGNYPQPREATGIPLAMAH